MSIVAFQVVNTGSSICISVVYDCLDTLFKYFTLVMHKMIQCVIWFIVSFPVGLSSVYVDTFYFFRL